MCGAAGPLSSKTAPTALPLAAGSIPGFGHRPYDSGGASGLAPAMFQHPISDGSLAGDRQLSAMFFHTVANTASARLDRATERFDITHTRPLHQPTFGQCGHGNKNSERDPKSIF